jgi:hypothetical protein
MSTQAHLEAIKAKHKVLEADLSNAMLRPAAIMAISTYKECRIAPLTKKDHDLPHCLPARTL